MPSVSARSEHAKFEKRRQQRRPQRRGCRGNWLPRCRRIDRHGRQSTATDPPRRSSVVRLTTPWLKERPAKFEKPSPRPRRLQRRDCCVIQCRDIDAPNIAATVIDFRGPPRRQVQLAASIQNLKNAGNDNDPNGAVAVAIDCRGVAASTATNPPRRSTVARLTTPWLEESLRNLKRRRRGRDDRSRATAA